MSSLADLGQREVNGRGKAEVRLMWWKMGGSDAMRDCGHQHRQERQRRCDKSQQAGRWSGMKERHTRQGGGNPTFNPTSSNPA